MALRKGNRVDRGYATTAEDDGVNYREIAEIMTIMGFPMNHSSARNHVLRAMTKFCKALVEEWSVDMDEDEMLAIVKAPDFQNGIADLMHIVEAQRRREARV